MVEIVLRVRLVCGDHPDVIYEDDGVDEDESSNESSKRLRESPACFAPAMVTGSWCSMAGALPPSRWRHAAQSCESSPPVPLV